MKSVAVVFVVLLLSARAAREADLDVGTVDQKLPAKAALVAPKNDEGITSVGLKGTVKGKVAKGEKRRVYVVVNPLTIENTWWVQEEVVRDGDSFSAGAQFGEGDESKGEYFAVLAIATDKKWPVGEKLDGLPEDATATKLKIVKRK